VLREHFRGRRIVVVANRIFSDLAEKIGYFDEVIEVERQPFEWDLVYRFRKVRQIRALGAEIAIHPIVSRLFWMGDSMIHASGARQRIGSEGDLSNMRSWQRRMARRWYTRLVPAIAGQLKETERNAEFLHGLGLDESGPGVARIPVLAELPRDLQFAGEYFIIFPGAGSTKRMWPPAKFAEAARAIAGKTDWRMVVCGGDSEVVLANTIIEQAELEGALSLAGRTSVTELVEMVRGARLLVGSETSATHIAAAVGTPSVCLLGGGHFGRFVPYPDNIKGTVPVPVFFKMECYGCNWQCIQPHEPGQPVPCITAIPIDEVIAATEFILAERKADVIENH
jgi:ADP-heptose:LPS heptosyltransferase